MAKDEKVKKDGEKGHHYDASDISVLEGLEPVRRRPGMYIGTTGQEGLHHLVWEIFDNSRDEAMGGFCNDIEIVLLPENRIRVADNGRGIPVDMHKKTKVSALETVMTTLHAGGKFGGEGYKVSGGLHGVGVSVVNALSEVVRAEVHRDGEFNWDTIVAHMRQQAYLVRGLRISILDLRKADSAVSQKANDVFYLRELGIDAPSITFYFEGGLRSLVSFQNRHLEPVHKTVFYVEKEQDGVQVEVALQYVDDIVTRISAFANNIYNAEGGTHITGFKGALTRTLNNFNKSGKESESFTGDDVLEGITAVVSVKLPEIQFEGQTKGKLGSVEARGAVEAVFAEGFSAFLDEHPEDARSIINKVLLALKARKAAKAAKDSVLRKGALEGMTLPGKLSDCQTKSAEEAELFIVEGDSAGGSSKQGRDRRTQAILPLRGKILNVERARLDRMLASIEIRALVVAMGTAIGDVFDISKLRYHRSIIATDADVDGAHIRTLLLTLFYRHLRPVIDGGFIYIAQPPLYKITKGKAIAYAYSDKEKEEALKEFGKAPAEGGSASGGSVQRYKGLGEMNPSELWETTMDPTRRVLKRVHIEDAEAADRIFDILMGSDVVSRKSFIKSNAKLANLDV